MDYYNWGQFPKPQEGEAEVGNRDGGHWSSALEATLLGPEAVRSRLGLKNRMDGGAGLGEMRELALLAGAQVQREGGREGVGRGEP